MGSSDLDARGLRRMAAALGIDDDVHDLELLPGGLAGLTFAFTLAGSAYVLKRYAAASPKAEVEFDNLMIARSIPIPTPEPVHYDKHGSWFGTPTIVMSRLLGHPEFHHKEVRVWTQQAAAALAAIHEVDPALARSTVTPRWQRFVPPTGALGAQASAAAFALEQLYAVAAATPVVFSPDDYNPGNLLFRSGELSGVVDWGEVTLEPRQAAVALYRHMLTIHPGGDAPDLFLTSYEQAAGVVLSDMPLWDVLYGLRACRPVPHWQEAFRGHGLELQAQEITNRSVEWTTRALRQLNHYQS